MNIRVVGQYSTTADGPAVLCEFHGFVTAMGEKLTDFKRRVPYGIRARVKRLTDHPRLGGPDGHDFTITSEVRLMDFENGVIVTQNTIYKFEV